MEENSAPEGTVDVHTSGTFNIGPEDNPMAFTITDEMRANLFRDLTSGRLTSLSDPVLRPGHFRDTVLRQHAYDSVRAYTVSQQEALSSIHSSVATAGPARHPTVGSAAEALRTQPQAGTSSNRIETPAPTEALLVSLLEAERTRCQAKEDPDERDDALGNLVEGAPEVVERIRQGMLAYAALLKETKVSPRTPEELFLSELKQRLAFNGVNIADVVVQSVDHSVTRNMTEPQVTVTLRHRLAPSYTPFGTQYR